MVIICNSGYGSAIAALISLSEEPIIIEGKKKAPFQFAIFDGLSQSTQNKWLGYYKGFPMMLDRAFSESSIPGFQHLCWKFADYFRKKSQEFLEVPVTESR